MENIFSGEQFQELCSVYIGKQEDLIFNPRIAAQIQKHLNIDAIPSPYNNPPIVFCYTHRIRDLAGKLNNFKYPFILISHNSDTNIDDSYHTFANHPKIFYWFTQNLNTVHPKISLIPIGVANTQWPHGSRNLFTVDYYKQEKVADLYFQFGPSNIHARQRCYEAVSQFYTFQPQLESSEYLRTLAKYKFCISPEGNGVDCHRIWEALLCNCIPIISDSQFAQNISTTYPVIVVKDWSVITPQFIASCEHKPIQRDKLEFEFYKNKIITKVYELYNYLMDNDPAPNDPL
jgi:hypothetical protein